MRAFIKVCERLQYIGIIGFIGIAIHEPSLSYFSLFWLFGVFVIVMNPRVFLQSIYQTIGMVASPLMHGFDSPSIDNNTASVSHGLPFDNEWVVVNGGVTKTLSHSWSIQTQRYAYDFIQLDEKGKSHKDEGLQLEDYYCYGQPIIATCEGIVREVVDIYPDSVINKQHDIDKLARDIRGNYIVIKNVDSTYSFYGHLKPKSIGVKEGQSIQKGDLLALCGNSGFSSEPHLHFHIQDKPSFYCSSGIPIQFEKIHIKEKQIYKQYDARKNEDRKGRYIKRGDFVNNQ